MSGPNHVVGGTIFTGIYLSMWDINIYANPFFLFFTAFFALLPDVDHTKSAIGKMFYPVAKLVDRKFGHRTITHSLVCYFSIALIVGLIEKIFFSPFHTTGVYTSIFFWAYGSHLILDMLTVKGVPLFYPFKKNPCVIPGNPKFRFKSADFKTEIICFTAFFFLSFSCKDLFAHGFWNTYNSSFSTVDHVANEMNLADNLVEVTYDISKNFKRIKGVGYGITSSANDITLITKDSFLVISETDKIYSLKPKRTNKKISIKEFHFTNINPDSLIRISQNKPIIKLSVTSSIPITYTSDNQLQTGNNMELMNTVNPKFYFKNADSLTRDIQQQIIIQQINLSKEVLNDQINAATRNRITTKYNQTLELLNSKNLAEYEKGVKDLPQAKADFIALQPYFSQTPTMKKQLDFLNNTLKIAKKVTIAGYLSYYQIQ